MKRIFGLILPLLLLTGCGTSTSIPVIRAIVEQRATEELSYEEIDANGKSHEVDSFFPDAAEVYTVDPFGLDCQVRNGKLRNQVVTVSITDANGNPVEDNTLRDIVYAAQIIEHAIFEFTIWKVQDHYFAFIKLNTNWSDPCELYQYNTATGFFHMLYQWDDVNLVGLQIPTVAENNSTHRS